jgi:PTS system nitrogen regulatory IIA component
MVALVILERINRSFYLMMALVQKRPWVSKEEIMLSDYLSAKDIIFIEDESRDAAINTLVDHLCSLKRIEDKQTFLDAVIGRERIVSTGIGNGVAIPHAKIDSLHDFVLTIGIHKKEGIDWNALDGAHVKVIFLIGGPSLDQKKYLKILSHLTSLLKEERFRKALFFYKDPEEILKIFKNYDRYLS